MLVMAPRDTVAVATAGDVGVTPGDVMSTDGRDVYPDPGSVTVIAVTPPVLGSTDAVATAPAPPPPFSATTALASTCGLLAQFGYGPK
jgi:hypothetical protein